MSASLLKDLLDAILPGVEQALRLRVEGRSVVRGKPPAWLVRATEIHVLPFQSGSTRIFLEAPSLIEAAPEQFQQLDLFTEIDPHQSCLDVYCDSLSDAFHGNLDSERFDGRLLETFLALEKVLNHAVEKLEWKHGGTMSFDTMSFDSAAWARLHGLERALPGDRTVQVVGKLDHLKHSQRAFTLVTGDGNSIKGVLTEDVDLDRLRNLWGKQARVVGMAKFRPSGDVLRLEAELVEPATAKDETLWSKKPGPLLDGTASIEIHKPQGPRSGLAAIFGQWPGDESDEDIEAALEEIS